MTGRPDLDALEAAWRIDTTAPHVVLDLIAYTRFLEEALTVIAAPDALLEANPEAFGASAARWKMAQANAALTSFEGDRSADGRVTTDETPDE